MTPLHLWTPQGPENSDNEALQADVMRFVAIIGLCLAAIFSLLKSLQPEPGAGHGAPPQAAQESQSATAVATDSVRASRSPAPLPAADRERGAERGPQARPGPIVETRPGPDGPREPTQTHGFTLSFASGEALHRLLAENTVALVAVGPETYWHYQPDSQSFRPGRAPVEYYEMEATTVPPRLRDWLQAAGVQARGWGVMLPLPIRRQLDEIRRRQRGGELIIDASGGVIVGDPGEKRDP